MADHVKLDVQALNLAARLALLTDGRVVPVTNVFDCEGDNVHSPERAVTFVAGDGGEWFSGLCADFEPARTQ